MKPEARELDQLVRDWCVAASRNEALLGQIAARALTAPPTSVVPFARALHILETQGTARFQTRIDERRTQLNALLARENQIDELGNPDNEPQAVFDILGDEVAALQGFDVNRIRQARLAHQDRAEAARAFLQTLGWEHLPAEASAMLQLAIADLADREQYDGWGLFVDHSAAEGWALGIQVIPRAAGETVLWSEADNDIREQAGIALQAALPGQGWQAKIEWPASYAGESIGLPLYIAGLVVRSLVPRHALTASTGRIDLCGRVTGVAGITKKIEAARRSGVRRLLVPKDNREEARAPAGSDLAVLPVGNVAEVVGVLRQSASSIQVGYSGLIRLVRASIPDYGLAIAKEVTEPSGFRFVVANAQGMASLWVHSNGRVRTDGAPGTARVSADRLIIERMPAESEPRETETFQLPTPQFQEPYRLALQDLGGASDPAGAYERWRMRLSRGRSRATIVLYTSGKCVLQGNAPAWEEARSAAEQILQPIGGLPSRRQSPAAPKATPQSKEDEIEPHIGTDEAGKGDYLGPLVSAAVFVDRDTGATLRQLGVRDSKTLSDKRVRELADEIRRLPDVRHAVTAINPRKFNELYEQMRREGKNLNSLLAWGHAKSIDNLLTTRAGKRVDAKFVVVDQFADKHYIEQRTRKFGMPIHQRHRAEEDIAVAAASVLARDGFLQWLERWSARTQIPLPKGASPQVIAVAKQFVWKWGARWLGEIAKLNS